MFDAKLKTDFGKKYEGLAILFIICTECRNFTHVNRITEAAAWNFLLFECSYQLSNQPPDNAIEEVQLLRFVGNKMEDACNF
jgi:hypothetical protein